MTSDDTVDETPVDPPLTVPGAEGETDAAAAPDDAAPDDAAPEDRAPSRARAVGAAVLRGVTGALVVALVGAVAYGASLVDAEPTRPAPARTLGLVPAATPVVCAGPTQLADVTTDGDPGFDPAPVGTVSSVAGVVVVPTTFAEPALRGLDDGPLDAAVAAGPDVSVLSAPAAGGASLWTVPSADGALLATGASSSLTSAGDLRGLAASQCQDPGIEHWLVAGSTEVGASARLVLQNPSRTAATVQLEVFGPAGRVDLAGPSVLSVPAGGTTTTLLEGVAAGQRRVVVHARASGALVAAYLQVSALDGVRPEGVDVVGAGGEPAVRQVLAGLVTPGSEAGGDGPVVRLLAPGQTAAVRLAVYGPSGRVLLPGAEDATLEAGVVTDVSLAGLPAGAYHVLVESDVPVVAAATAAATGADGTDVATVTSQDPGAAAPQWAMALPPGARPTLVLGAVPASVDAVSGALVAGLDEGVADGGASDAAAVPGARARVVVHDRAGALLLDQVLDLPAGATSTLPLATTLPGSDPASVVVQEVDQTGVPVAGTATRLVWGTWLSADAQDGTVDGLVAALSPASSRSVRTELALRAGLRAGLG